MDLTQAPYLNRIEPFSLQNALAHRGITSKQAVRYQLDVGAQRLIEEWKRSMGRLIAKKNNVPDEPMDPNHYDVLYRSGSASFEQTVPPPGMSTEEFDNLTIHARPIERFGGDDPEEWNLFTEYLPMDVDKIDDPNLYQTLSSVLKVWRHDKVWDYGEECATD